jgi:hypothetical protein
MCRGSSETTEQARANAVLSSGVLHGLSVALRWPGVRAILNAAKQARQRGEDAPAE